MIKSLVGILSIFLFLGCTEQYHYVRKVNIIVNYSNIERINKEYQKRGGKRFVEGFASPYKNPCEIWVQKRDTHVLGHEVEHCLFERGPD